MTPEGRIKAKVKAVLYRFNVYYFMPVQNGMGATGLDFHCFVRGYCRGGEVAVAFFIETKAPDKVPTARQDILILELRGKGAEVFIVSNDVELKTLEIWLASITDSTDNEYSSSAQPARPSGADSL